MTRIKFCGITSLEDAQLCVEHGAWAIGLIFVPSSARRVTHAGAVQIASGMRRKVEVAGVFQNAKLDHVVRSAEALELTLVQLHGDEGPSYCAEVQRRTGAKVIKAARVKTRADIVALEPYNVDFHLLDGEGGTPFEWDLVRVRRTDIPLVVAGGLTPENVAAAIAETQPFAVDVASGVEERPGVKDPEKVAAFAQAVQPVHSDSEVQA